MIEVSEQPLVKEKIPPRFDAIIACGMGPMELKPSRSPRENPVPVNVFSFFNAVAAKIAVAKGWATEGILSGYRSRQSPRDGARPDVQLEELARSEGGLLGHIYDQTRPKETARSAVLQAVAQKTIEQNARTTFGNIFEGLNLLDAKAANGHFEGTFGVVSCEFHGPRIAEMLKAFGLTNGRFVAAEGVLRAAGYTGGQRGWGRTYKESNDGAYPGQPAGLQNLQDNPSYVTRDLAVIASPRRFHEVAIALKRYYRDRETPVALPECFERLPEVFDPGFDYEELKIAFAAVSFTKHGFIGDAASALEAYKRSAVDWTGQTVVALSKQ